MNTELTFTETTLVKALILAEAALSDIGDADREPGDDLEWCEKRAAQDLPFIRSVLSKINPQQPCPLCTCPSERFNKPDFRCFSSVCPNKNV